MRTFRRPGERALNLNGQCGPQRVNGTSAVAYDYDAAGHMPHRRSNLLELAGGEFSSGFIAGFSGSAFGSEMVKVPSMGKAGDLSDGRWALRTTTVGGTVSELTGGDFTNGADSAFCKKLEQWAR